MSQLSRLIPTSGPGSGTVTSISAGTGITLTPNPITTTGTVALTIPVTIADGGTNATSMTNTDGVVYFNGTSLVTTANGTTGQVLTATTSNPPSWENLPASGIQTIDGDTGHVTGSTINLIGGLATYASGTANFVGNDTTTMNLSFTDAFGNVGIGTPCFSTTMDGNANVALGNNCGELISTGYNNVMVGQGCLNSLTTGNGNTVIGNAAGTYYLGGESGNILVSDDGIAAESNTIRIGSIAGNGEITSCFVGGISGVTVSNINAVTIDTVTGQLGSATFPSSSISITGDSGGVQVGDAFTFTASSIGLSFAGSSGTFTLGGTLDLANGGTNADLTASDGGIFYSTASAGAILVGTATARQILQSGSSTTPAWSTATYPATTTINQLLYSSSNNVIGGVTAGDYGVLISSSSGVPSWLANGTTGQILTATTSGTPSWESPASSSISITGDSGGVQTGNAFTFTGGTTGLTFAGATDILTVGGKLIIANGGTDSSSFNTNGVVISGTSSTAALTALSLSSGQVVIGGTSTPAAATLTAGTGITIANGNNTITISAGGAGFTWNDVTGGSASMVAENGYITDSSGLTTLTMPTNNSLGDTIKVVGKGSGGWKIVYGALQNIIFGASTTTTTTGFLASSNQNDCCELVCTTASIAAPIFTVVSSVGNLTIS